MVIYFQARNIESSVFELNIWLTFIESQVLLLCPSPRYLSLRFGGCYIVFLIYPHLQGLLTFSAFADLKDLLILVRARNLPLGKNGGRF